MTENEIRKYIEELREKARLFSKNGYATAGMEKAFNKSADSIENLLNELEAYRAIGTIEEFKALKEKNTPKKRGIWKSGHTCCPNCERGVLTADRFCSYCGQALKPKETLLERIEGSRYE